MDDLKAKFDGARDALFALEQAIAPTSDADGTTASEDRRRVYALRVKLGYMMANVLSRAKEGG